MDEKQKKKLIWQLPFLVLLIVGTVLIISHQRSMPYRQVSDFVFGTTYKVIYQCDSDLTFSIRQELMKVDRSLSPFNKESVITAVNQNREVTLDPYFIEVFTKAMEVSRETEGAFDIKHQVDSLRQIIGYQKISLTGGKVKKQDPRMMLDCSAIAKGFGVDAVARMLRDRGVQNFMVEIGGEVVTCGVNAQRLPWRVGVIKPSEDSLSVGHELQTILNVTDKALATSGNYRNFYYKNGRRYAHTIDPKTGYPVQHSLLSATVLANSCTVADAYATSFMVMGLERAQQLLERHSELMAYLIYDDGHGDIAVWFSPSLRNKIEE